MHLNATDNDFLGWDQKNLADVRNAEAEKEEQHKLQAEESVNGDQNVIKAVPRQFFSHSVIVSPVRLDEEGPPRDVVINEAGFPVNPSVEEYKAGDLAISMAAHYKLCKSTF